MVAACLPDARPVVAEELPSYVGSENCAACHRAEADSWRNSDHKLAWTMPSHSTVIADFDGTEFHGAGISVVFSQDADGYHASVTEMDGGITDYDVHSVVGIAPLQQYLFETAPGRLQSFDVVWNDDLKEWYHLYPDQILQQNDGLHWSGPYKNWNARCAECHATGFEKNYSASTRSYNSEMAEIGVGCEACHGPGSVHLEWALKREPIQIPALDAYGFTMPTDAGGEAWIQQCAGCHSRREAFGQGNPVPGTPYFDNYRLALLLPDLYYPDGQIKAEVYVYGSFLQSKMYAKGVSCANCHDPHSAQLIAEDNAVCTQCHSLSGNPDFPSLPLKDFDSPGHHFHAVGSEGALCKNCHMTEQTYMGIDKRADHSFRIPRPDLAAVTGAPDACTSCHDDRTPQWAAAVIADWYPSPENRGPHYGTAFAHAARDPAGAVPSFLKIAQDQNAADIVRATALYLMSASVDEETIGMATPLLQDDSSLVRTAAIRLQREAPQEQRIQNLAGLLSDPLRLVRMTVAAEFLRQPVSNLPGAMNDLIGRAIVEWQQSLGNRLDFPETHLVLGGTALAVGNAPAAAAAFRKATEQDPQQIEAWIMVIRLEAAMKGAEAGISAANEALEKNPENRPLLELKRLMVVD